MEKNIGKRGRLLDSNFRSKVVKNLRHVILDRLSHPKVSIEGSTAEKVAKRGAIDIEESCYKAADEKSFYTYASLITDFFLHLCPYFKTARHSMLFRDMIIGYKMRAENGDIPDSINIAKRTKADLWPEIYNNNYLSTAQRQDMFELRDLEYGMVVELVDLIRSYEDIVFTSKNIGEAQTKICFGESNACWSVPEPEMNMKCLITGTCEASDITMCMSYEEFLIHFAENGMVGLVTNPMKPDENLKAATTENIRKVWNTELKMTRVYLDILEEMK